MRKRGGAVEEEGTDERVGRTMLGSAANGSSSSESFAEKMMVNREERTSASLHSAQNLPLKPQLTSVSESSGSEICKSKCKW